MEKTRLYERTIRTSGGIMSLNSLSFVLCINGVIGLFASFYWFYKQDYQWGLACFFISFVLMLIATELLREGL